MNLQKAGHFYLCIPNHPEAIKEFEKLMNDYAIELTHELKGPLVLYKDIVIEDIFFQQVFYDFQTEVALYNKYGGPTFPVDMGDWEDNQIDNASENNFEWTMQIEEVMRMDMMLYMNRHHIFYAVGMKDRGSSELVIPISYFNSPIKGVW